jgi:ankyrin repeat protein
MNITIILGCFFYSQVLRLATMTLIALAWSSFAFCGEIHVAAQNGDLQKVKELLENRPKLVSSKNDFGLMLLHLAARGGYKDMAEFLLNKGAKVNIRDGNGLTPMDYAANGGHKDIMELLLAKGAGVNVKDKYGNTPLHSAVTIFFGSVSFLNPPKSIDRKGLVELLLAKGADVNVKNDKGWTPLHEAAKCGIRDVVESLLAKGAGVNARNRDGNTPLHIALHLAWISDSHLSIDLGFYDVVEILRQHGGQE